RQARGSGSGEVVAGSAGAAAAAAAAVPVGSVAPAVAGPLVRARPAQAPRAAAADPSHDAGSSRCARRRSPRAVSLNHADSVARISRHVANYSRVWARFREFFAVWREIRAT